MGVNFNHKMWSVWRRIPEPVRTALRRSIPEPIIAGLATRLKSPLAWDTEYAAGHWDFLGAEIPRFAVVGAYCRNFGSVLDIGCGKGLLYDWLAPTNRPYVGVDISSVAIEQARQRQRSDARFVVADMSTFEMRDRFDVVVINEALYDAPEPANVIRRAARLLLADGAFVISMYKSSEAERAWRRCVDDLVILDETRILHGGAEWAVRLCRPTKWCLATGAKVGLEDNKSLTI